MIYDDANKNVKSNPPYDQQIHEIHPTLLCQKSEQLQHAAYSHDSVLLLYAAWGKQEI